MTYEPDILIVDEHGTHIAAVEVKRSGRALSDRTWAARVHANYRAGHGGSRYFLLITPQVGYLWTADSLRSQAPGPAEVEFPTADLLQRYMGGEPTQSGGPRALDYVVFRWLLDAVEGRAPQHLEAMQALESAGFLADIQGAAVSFGLAA